MSGPLALIAIPTLNRAAQLDTTLASITAQAAARGIEIVVVDDGPSRATRDVAERHGVSYREAGAPGGPNAARNLAFAATDAELVILLDDDIRAWPHWLDELLAAHAREPDDVAVLAGRIVPWLDPEFAPHSCGRHGAPVTELDLGDEDQDARHGWSANMGVRRAWWLKAGPFDEAHAIGGDEEEWIDRAAVFGGRVRYIAVAGVQHERIGQDASLRALMRSARGRGRNLKLFESQQGRAKGLPAELVTLLACLAHVVVRRCPMGWTLVAHSYGRVEQTLAPRPAPARPGLNDFLSGRSGTVAGKRGLLLRAADLAYSVARAPITASEQLRARRVPPRKLLALAIARDPAAFASIAAELQAGRHTVELDVQPIDARGKYERLNAMLAAHDLTAYDHVLLVDDDVELPRGFTDRLIWAVERSGLLLAQPAHRRHSHAAWPVTRRRFLHPARLTHYVEIGPVTLLRGAALEQLIPFPADLTMGWGLDNHWGALAGEAGWPIGVVDSTPLLHLNPVAGVYGTGDVIEAARTFLKDRPYVTREQAAWSTPAPAVSAAPPAVSPAPAEASPAVAPATPTASPAAGATPPKDAR